MTDKLDDYMLENVVKHNDDELYSEDRDKKGQDAANWLAQDLYEMGAASSRLQAEYKGHVFKVEVSIVLPETNLN